MEECLINLNKDDDDGGCLKFCNILKWSAIVQGKLLKCCLESKVLYDSTSVKVMKLFFLTYYSLWVTTTVCAFWDVSVLCRDIILCSKGAEYNYVSILLGTVVYMDCVNMPTDLSLAEEYSF
jgi:hypothetical protein